MLLLKPKNQFVSTGVLERKEEDGVFHSDPVVVVDVVAAVVDGGGGEEDGDDDCGGSRMERMSLWMCRVSSSVMAGSPWSKGSMRKASIMGGSE